MKIFRIMLLALLTMVVTSCKKENSPYELKNLFSEMIRNESKENLSLLEFTKADGRETMEDFTTNKLYETEANVTLKFNEDVMFIATNSFRTNKIFDTQPLSEKEFDSFTFPGFFLVKGKKGETKTLPFIIRTEITEKGVRIHSIKTNFTKEDL